MKIKTDQMLSKLGHLNDEQFKVLFFIYNTINMNSGNEHSVKIYRAVLADLCGKSERTISRITDKLEEEGLIVKDSVSDGTKLYNYYSIPMAKNNTKLDNRKQKTTQNLVTDDRVKELKVFKENKIIKKENIIKEKKVEEEEKIKEFNVVCGVSDKETESKMFEDEVSDWNEFFQRIGNRIKKASTIKEIDEHIHNLSITAKKAKTLPNNWEEKVSQLKEIRDTSILRLKTSLCCS